MAEDAPAEKERVERAPTMLQLAVVEVLKPVEHLEEAAELEKVRHKFCQIFKRAGNKMELNLSFVQMVDAFADQALNSIFSSLWDKEWLSEIDMVVPLTVALRERYPRFAGLSHFDKTAADACERVLDVKRADAAIWEVVQVAADSKAVRGKILEAVDASRKSSLALAHKGADGAAGGADGMQTFMAQWITGTVNSLKATSGGKPEKTATSETLATLFVSLCEKGGVPRVLTNVFGQPPAGWPFIQSAVEEAYGTAASGGALAREAAAGLDAEGPPAKRCRSREEGYGTLQPGAEEQKAWQYQVRHMQRWAGGPAKAKPANTWSNDPWSKNMWSKNAW